ncbi:MAG: sialate O-acetylesterase, partial [Ignavibacteriaceae bacterium]|nr:sialate O-acetylesterase [Ignavibacteriaceae bacterium]
IGKVNEYKSTVDKVAASKNDLIKKNEWVLSHPVIDVSNRDAEHEWENLDFKDSACSEVNFNDAGWKVMNLPVNWENTEVGNFDGAVWFRKKIEIPKAWIGKELIAELGPIDDMDRTFINGKFIGGIEKIGYWDKPRVYNIPKEIITDSVLNIAIRVIDCGGGGGIFGNNVKMNIHPVNDSGFVTLSGGWKYLPVAEEYKYGKFYIYKIENSEFYSRPKTSVDITENTPTVLYNGMIAPIIPYGIKGVIWYQGESNSSKAYSYKTLLPLMIENWRGNWGEGNFPFYYVQIAPFTYSQTEKSFIIRDAQFSTLSIPNTGMAVTLDIATVNNIHPPDKQDVGKRLALWALAKDYHKKVTYSGPLYKSMKIDKNKIVLTFNYAGKGLVLKKIKDETNFIVAGEDKKFVKADVTVKGGKLIVSNPEVKKPVAVRYTWSNTEEATLFNSEMLPASTFRADNWDE